MAKFIWYRCLSNLNKAVPTGEKKLSAVTVHSYYQTLTGIINIIQELS